MKLSPTEKFAINRKSLATLQLSCDLKPDALKRDLTAYIQEIIHTVTMKRLKHAKVVLLETEEEK